MSEVIPSEAQPEIGTPEWTEAELAKLQSSQSEPEATEAAPAADPEPQPEPVPDPQPTVVRWKDLENIRLAEDDPDVPLGFFKGKPLVEPFKSQQYAQQKIDEQGKEISQLRMQLAAREAVKEVLGTQAQPAEKPKTRKELYAELGVDLDVDPIANPERYEEARAAIDRKEFERIATEKAQAERAVIEQREQQQRYFAGVIGAVETARRDLGIPEDVYKDRAIAIVQNVRYEKGDAALLDPNEIKAMHARMWGESPAPQPVASQPPPVPEVPNPPGAKRPAQTAPSPTAAPTLRAEQQRFLDQHYGHLPPEEKAKVTATYLRNLERYKQRGYGNE